ncbi:MAG: GMC family oxidoreductase [Synechococcaceae cyanobacterium]|nr:GMC family oxidoreductase [Synechococcaceae cyanobacterium]
MFPASAPPEHGFEPDAIVVGAGATGGVAAMVLAEAGLRVLVLEAGPDRSAARSFGQEPLNSLRRLEGLGSGRHRHQANHPGYWKHNPDLYIDEGRHPWLTPPDAPFLWTRGRQVGGKSLTWGGITLRLSESEFRAGERDGVGPAWPIGSTDLSPYYDRLESLLGVHGSCDGLPQLPDGHFRPPLPFTPGERRIQEAIGRELGLPLIHSRGFALHRPERDGPWPRSSAQGVTLARALATGRARLRSQAVVSHLAMNPQADRAEGVVLLRPGGGEELLRAPLVVLCASTIETTRLLLHSSEAQRSGGLIDPSGCLGRFLMDHISTSRFFVLPDVPPPAEPAELSGAGSAFIPNTVNLAGSPAEAAALGFRRGYGLWTAVQRFDPPRPLRRHPHGAVGFLIGHGEVLPHPDNRVELDADRRDADGLPLPRIECRWRQNEQAMVAHMQQRMAEVVTAAGGRMLPIEELFVIPLLEPLVRGTVAVSTAAPPPGYYIHELGGARMAAREQDGVVDGWNRCWRAPNVLVVDGACWPSAGWQSPTLTAMAITWRACAAAASGRGDL